MLTEDKYKIITDVNSINKNKWENFVQSHHYANFFHTYDFYKVLLNTKGFSPIVICIVNKDFIHGILVGNIITNKFSILSNFSKRLIIWGGPLVKNNNNHIASIILSVIDNLSKKYNIVFSQFRNLYNISFFNKNFLENGYNSIDHLDILILLKKDWKTIISDIHKSRKRNFTKSRNKGTKFSELKNSDEVYKGFLLIKETYNRISLPYPDLSHFISLFKYAVPKGRVHFFGAYLNHNLLGIRIVLTYKNIIYDYFAGSSREYSNYYPNDFLIMSILEWGHNNGYHMFDFGGAGKPNIPYSVRDYKLQFGKNIVNYGRYEKIYKPLVYKIASLTLTIWRKIIK